MNRLPLDAATKPTADAPLRDRFLSEFALSLVEGGDLAGLLRRCVRELCRLLDVDRVTLFLQEPTGGEPFVMRAEHSRDGIEPIPEEQRSLRFLQMFPSLTSGRPLVAPDVAAHEELRGERERLGRLHTKSLILVPITIDGRLRGLVSAATVGRLRAWVPADVAFLESAVRHVSAAVKQMELMAELSRERDRLKALFDLSSAVHRSGSSAEVIAAALAGLKETLAFPCAGFMLLTEAGDELACAASYGPQLPAGHDGTFRIPLLPLPEGGGPVLLADVERDLPPGALRDALGSLGARSAGLFPLHAGGQSLGVLLVGGDGDRSIEPDDVVALHALAGIFSAALERRRAAEAAERSMREARVLSEASRALLTRTANRDVLMRQILEALVSEFGQANCSLQLVDRERKIIVEAAYHGQRTALPGEDGLRIDGPGLIAWAVRNGTAVNVPDVRRDLRYLEGWPAAISEVVVPIVLDDEVMGAFDIQSERPAAYTGDDVRLLTDFAERAALALRLSELVRKLEERTTVLESVARATHLLNFRLNAPDLLSSFVEETCRAFPASDGCVAYVADESGALLTIAAAYGLGQATLASEGTDPFPADRFLCAGRAFRENRPVVIDVKGLDELMLDYPVEARARVRSVPGASDLRQLLAVPIRVGERRLGVIEVMSCRPNAFSPTDVEMLGLLAEQTAIALRNARLIDELQRSSRLKDDFLANLSHEVRTPLTGIVGWAEVLLDARGEDPQTRRALEAVLGQAETLNRLLSDIIDLSRIDSFGLDIRHVEVRVAEVVNAAVDVVSPGAAKRGVVIRCDVPSDLPPLHGDPARLKQVLWNLLANGVKFSDPGGSVSLSARRSATNGLELRVEDTGHGIDPSFLPYVFDRFRQEETSSNRRFGGLGVGLSIARAIVAAHGGTIEVASDGRGRGSRFTVQFPPGGLARSEGTAVSSLLAGAPPRGGRVRVPSWSS